MEKWRPGALLANEGVYNFWGIDRVWEIRAECMSCKRVNPQT